MRNTSPLGGGYAGGEGAPVVEAPSVAQKSHRSAWATTGAPVASTASATLPGVVRKMVRSSTYIPSASTRPPATTSPA
jgi:hypothetical protein